MIEGETRAITSLSFARQTDNCACHKWGWGGAGIHFVLTPYINWPAGIQLVSDFMKTRKKRRRTKSICRLNTSRSVRGLETIRWETRVALLLFPASCAAHAMHSPPGQVSTSSFDGTLQTQHIYCVKLISILAKAPAALTHLTVAVMSFSPSIVSWRQFACKC